MPEEKNNLVIKAPKNCKDSITEMESFFSDLHKLISTNRNLSKSDKEINLKTILNDNFIHYQIAASKKTSEIISSLLYTKYPSIEIETKQQSFEKFESKKIKKIILVGLAKHQYFPIKTNFNVEANPYTLLAALASKLDSQNDFITLQLIIKPFSENWLRQYIREKFFFIFGTLNNIRLFIEKPFLEKKPIDYYQEVQNKFNSKLFLTTIKVIIFGESEIEINDNIAFLKKVLSKYDNGDVNSLQIIDKEKKPIIINSREIAAIFHFPDENLHLEGIEQSSTKQIEPPMNLVKTQFLENPKISTIGNTRYRNKLVQFGIEREDRSRHFYIIGKTGMGKSKLIELMAIADIENDCGLCLIDPHGDLAQELLTYIPKRRIKDVVYFNPADLEYSIGFNPLECNTPEAKDQVVSGFISIFKKIFGHNWSNRLEHMLRFLVLALVEVGNVTVIDIVKMLTDIKFRQKIVAQIENPVVKNFWTQEFAAWNEKFDNEAIIPIINQVGQFISNDYIRRTVEQVHSGLNIEQVMSEGKILIINIAKGKLGEENTALLGSMIITKIQEATMARASLPENERKSFYLYVDEFQHFATESFNQILSEARKFNLSVTIAHQYIDQLTDSIKKTVFGNIGSFIAFRVGPEDARFLAREFTPEVVQEDFINLDFRNFYTKISINGKTTKPFSARSLDVLPSAVDYTNEIIEYCRNEYGSKQKNYSNSISDSDINYENEVLESKFEEPLI